MSTSAGETPDIVADYRAFDFEGLWRGREKVTGIEAALVRSLLGPGRWSRLLEIGTGFGRLTATLRSLTNEYVGVDFDPAGLSRARAGIGGEKDSDTRWALANLHRLPFSPGSFTAIAMIRLAHHLPRWEQTVRTMASLLRPGGRFLVTVFPAPTIGTLAEDVKGALSSGPPGRWGTWARGEDVHLSDTPHPKYIGTRGGYRRGLERSGLRIVAGGGSGLEEVVPGIPIRGWVEVARLGEPLPLFSMKWYAADRPGSAVGPLPPIDSIFACPRCQSALPSFAGGSGAPTSCASCGFEVKERAGIPDLRYLPMGSVEIGPTLTPG